VNLFKTGAAPNLPADCFGIDGTINCIPLGMTLQQGTPLSKGTKGLPRWAFDAVSTPENT
jgi:shikimate dehydrogenase